MSAGSMNDDELSLTDDSIDRLLTTILLVVMFTASLVTVMVASAPSETQHFTDFFLLGENGTAWGYPERVATGEIYPLFIGIKNHEGKDQNYSVEIWFLDAVFNGTTNNTNIQAMDFESKVSLQIPNDETILISYNLSVTKTGYNRVVFLLFPEIISGPGYGAVNISNMSSSDLEVMKEIPTGFNSRWANMTNASSQDLYLRISVFP
jgi:uncharacterized membrane protein